MILTVSKLPHPEHCGDWHDKPLRWVVMGAEEQKFSTKRDALLWARLRRQCATLNETFTRFMRAQGLYA